MLVRKLISLAATLSFVIVAGCAAQLSDSRSPAPAPGKAAVASADPLATQAGLDVMAAGGNAFDAAVAVAATLGVVEPSSSGFGGGGFFLLYIAATDEYRFIDAREMAPILSTRDMYLDEDGNPVKGLTVSGPLAAGIPGEPAGMAYLAENFGTLPFADLLAPAIRHAEEGFTMSRRALLGLRFRKRSVAESPAMAEVFLPNGELPAIGDVIRQPDLATTLRRMAADGADGFYKGETAHLLVDGVQAAGGIWTLDDLSNYRVIEREPQITNYRGMKVVSAPLPSSGGIVLTQVFNFLDGYAPEQLAGVQGKHLLIEGMRRAYRDRALYMGDTDYVAVPVARLTSRAHMDAQRASVALDRATPSSELDGIPDDGSAGDQTTHFSVIDAAGNRVAATITINTWYGAAFIPPGTGVILNNEMDDFSIKPGVPNEFELVGDEANAVAPGKRPLSSMSPTFLESDRGIAVVGTPGGSRIITMVLNASLDWFNGATAEDMVSRKRFHHQYLPDRVSYEPGAFSADEIAALEAMGHTLKEVARPYGNMNVVTYDFATGEVRSATDPRGEGEGRVY
ncbi:MAG: gamma-glutamyltransferase [Gammaproteobacteria bacterium]|nr:gamma-glutamyltransferase [Gammaproteobacteria bacterium]